MDFTLKAEGEELVGHHCSVFEDGDRIDCLEEDDAVSIRVKRTFQNVYQGTIKSGYSLTTGKLKLTFDVENKALLFEILERPEGVFYLPTKALFYP